MTDTEHANPPQRTALYEAHVAAGGKMVDFAGWMLPVNYGSQIEEHQAVRQACGMFDVSHMTIIDVQGVDAEAFLRTLVANDVAKLSQWGALYGALLNHQGGVIDDLIVYFLPEGYRCVVNASTRDKVLAWFEKHALPGMTFVEQPLSMIALQGPQALAHISEVSPNLDVGALKPFSAQRVDEWLVGRTGYTGEDGVEIMLPEDQAASLWQALLDRGVQPAGLGARDTLRLEAGLNLYGQDLDEETSPLASNISWTVKWQPQERDFIGRAAIEPQRGQSPMLLKGLVMRERGILRHGQRVTTSAGDGIITSGTFSPSLSYSIALARVPAAAEGTCQVDIRGKLKEAQFVKLPFVRHGKNLVDPDE